MTTDIFQRHGINEPVLMLAPMEGITNYEFRHLVLELSELDFVATEFIRLTNAQQSIKPIARHDNARLQIQIMASHTKVLVGAIETFYHRGQLTESDWIDINVGCPSRRVNSHGAGAALLKDRGSLLDMIKSVRALHKGPLSIKTRLGFEHTFEFPELLKTLSKAPLDFITLHARLKCARYEEPLSLDALQRAARELPFPVIGNGDVWSQDDALRMLETGVRGVMCGRGAVRDPLLFLCIRRALRHEKQPDHKLKRRLTLLFALQYAEALVLREKKPGKQIGLFKETAGYLSQNPLIGRDFFREIRVMTTWEEILDYLKQKCARDKAMSFSTAAVHACSLT